ncbi:hypothetical protein [Luteolibacter sp. Populi]|uniref:hypothetical protein n=1 Tax=Luteolibacter sp. Populi TaxID=3230487 RepID=UPI00346743E3
MNPRLALVAHDIVIAADTGVPSAFHVMEGIVSESYPMFLPMIAFLTVWHKEEGDPDEARGAMAVSLDDEQLISQDMDLTFSGSNVARLVARLQGLVIPHPGALKFSYKIGDKEAAYTVDTSSRANMTGVTNPAPVPQG